MKVMVQTTSIHLSAHDLNRLVCDLYFWAQAWILHTTYRLNMVYIYGR